MAADRDMRGNFVENQVALEVNKKQEPLSKNGEKLDFKLTVKELSLPFLFYFVLFQKSLRTCFVLLCINTLKLS